MSVLCLNLYVIEILLYIYAKKKLYEVANYAKIAIRYFKLNYLRLNKKKTKLITVRNAPTLGEALQSEPTTRSAQLKPKQATD